MSRAPVFLALLVAAAVGFLAGSFLTGGNEPEERGLVPNEREILEAEAAELEAVNRDLRASLDKERVRTRALTAALEGDGLVGGGLLPPAPDDAGAPPRAPGDGEAGAEGGRILFGSEIGEGALRKVDWVTVGANLNGMLRILEEGAPVVLRGESLPPELGERIQKLNSPVLAAAIKVRDWLPGRSVQEKFTSAPFILNAIRSTLAAGGLPLSSEQEDQLLELGRDLLVRDERRIEAYDDSTFALARVLDEVELKGEFFAAVFERLTAAQQTMLRPEPMAGRLRLDIFSPGMILGGRVEPILFTDEMDLGNKIGGRVWKSLGLDKEQAPAATTTVRRWAASIPRDLLAESWDGLDRRGMFQTERALAWGRQQLLLLEGFVNDVELEGRQAAKARGVSNVLVGLAEDRGPD